MKMKKVFLLSMIAGLMLSACGYESKEYKALKKQNDSILAVQQQQIAEMNEYIATIQDIDNGFASIKQSQDYISLNASAEGQPTQTVRTRLTNDVQIINQILADNKTKIDELEKKIQSGKFQSTELRKTVKRLTETLNQKNKELQDMEKVLAGKDIKIDSLTTETQNLNRRTVDLESKNAQKEKEIADQDALIHKAYYKIATTKEIKESNIDVKKMKTNFRTSLFTAVDVRQFDSLPIDSKKAKILTKHPANSYELRLGADKKYTLIIKNQTDFWAVSKYLLIQKD